MQSLKRVLLSFQQLFTVKNNNYNQLVISKVLSEKFRIKNLY